MAENDLEHNSTHEVVIGSDSDSNQTTGLASPLENEAGTASCERTPLQQLLKKRDLNAAAACLAFAELLETAGNSEQAEFFYEQTRSIVAEHAADLVNNDHEC
jgi:hypothetical protein